MKEYNVGDIVTIKPLSWYYKNKDNIVGDVEVPFTFRSEMSRFCGETARIVKKSWSTHRRIHYYNLSIDEHGWNWGSDMFEDIKKQRKDKIKKIESNDEC